jgi:DNA polymerase V
MFALCDCNNFYASCERLFRPDLERRPVAVLSNNDGCVIARSSEVKALGVPMGAPYFREEGRFRHFGVEVSLQLPPLRGSVQKGPIPPQA